MSKLVFPAALALLIVCPTGEARDAAALRACRTIESLPAKLSQPGNYCLAGDLVMSMPDPPGDRVDAAIEIEADDGITLDCEGHAISGSAWGPDAGVNGIVSDGVDSVRLRNCRIDGFFHGISLAGGSGHLVENNHVERSRSRGIVVLGQRGSMVRNNVVLDTGGSDFARTIGIAASTGTDVVENRIERVHAGKGNTSDALGISLIVRSSGDEPSRVADNRIDGVSASGGRSIGIRAKGGTCRSSATRSCWTMLR